MKIRHRLRLWDVVDYEQYWDVSYGHPGIKRTRLCLRRGNRLETKILSGWWNFPIGDA